MVKLDAVAVGAEGLRKNEEGAPLFFFAWTAPGTVFASIFAKEQSDSWTGDDALIAAKSLSPWLPIWAVGPTAVCAAAGLGEMEFIGAVMVASPCRRRTSG
jgi:hypothetical protein